MVITHHAPLRHGVSRPADEGNAWGTAFGTELIGQTGEERHGFGEVGWGVFGHTHYCVEFRMGGVKVVSNQRGYIVPQIGSLVEEQRNSVMQRVRKRITGRKDDGDRRFDVEKTILV